MLDKNGVLLIYFFDENLYDENIKDYIILKLVGLVFEVNIFWCKVRKWI